MTNSDLTPFEKALAYLDRAHEFQLGELPTEGQHPATMNLAVLANSDLNLAISLLKQLEIEACRKVLSHLEEIEKLKLEIRDTLESNGRVFLCGCGATGRLGLGLETLWRRLLRENHADRPSKLSQSIVSFIAGGDYALVRSIENFEDHSEYGGRQLRDLGFSKNDLLIGISEGGETPFVIGATEEAAEISKRSPYFLFCNPPEILCRVVDRSRKILKRPDVRPLAIPIGPMALAGSTRLQACTVLMLAVGSALFGYLNSQDPVDFVNDLLSTLEKSDFQQLAPLIEREAEVYAEGHFCLHRSLDHALTVLTDTTERAPTFSLTPFENTKSPQAPMSWTYLHIPGSASSKDAWQTLLERSPRPIKWPLFDQLYGRKVIGGFDFSGASEIRRSGHLPPSKALWVYLIKSWNQSVLFEIDGHRAEFSCPSSLLTENLLVKTALNISSTLVMGRLHRYQSNLMLFVRPTNYKLIDRTVRCVQSLLADSGIKEFAYNDITYALFEVMETLPHDESAAIRVLKRLKETHRELKQQAS